MAKPQPIEFKSDDCAVTIDGVEYTPHEGESVWVVPGLSAGAVHALHTFQQVTVEMDAVRGDADEGQQTTRLMDGALQSLLVALAPRIVKWTWTDMAGRPLPQPDGTPGPLQVLENEELFYLLTLVKGETPAQAKNDSRPSPTTS